MEKGKEEKGKEKPMGRLKRAWISRPLSQRMGLVLIITTVFAILLCYMVFHVLLFVVGPKTIGKQLYRKSKATFDSFAQRLPDSERNVMKGLKLPSQREYSVSTEPEFFAINFGPKMSFLSEHDAKMGCQVYGAKLAIYNHETLPSITRSANERAPHVTRFWIQNFDPDRKPQTLVDTKASLIQPDSRFEFGGAICFGSRPLEHFPGIL
jgi:hypothetical protein